MATTEQKTQTTNAAGEFGSSTSGARLDYQNAKCNDLFFAILFILHLLAILGVCVATNGVLIPGYKKTLEDLGIKTPTISIPIPTIAYIAFVVVILVSCLWGVAWLKICERWPTTIIKVSLIMLIMYGVILCIYGAIFGNTGYIVVGAIFALIALLYTWCVWGRIPFSSVLLGISAAITTTFQGTIFISLATIPMNLLWKICWFFCILGIILEPVWKTYVLTTCFRSTFKGQPPCADYQSATQPQGASFNFGTIFLLLVSLYWGYNVVKNIAHTTTCGVVGGWYFSSGVVHNLTGKALKRSLTTSFGSIALGSLIVAILQALKAMLRSVRGACACIVYCFLLCIEWLIKKFNKYAFCYCAIYGMTFMQAAGAVWNLLFSKGIMLIINDSIVGCVVAAGNFLGFILALIVSYAMFAKELTTLHAANNMLGFYFLQSFCFVLALIGYAFTAQILQVLNSAIACLFVCFAEEPAALKTNRPEQYNALQAAGHPRVARYIQFGHAGEENDNNATGQPQQQQQQPR